MIKELIKLATHLDSNGFKAEADYLDAVIKRMAAKRRPGARRGGGSWIENKIQEASRQKKMREEMTGEVSTFSPHPDRPGVLIGPGGEEISIEDMGLEPPRAREPGSLMGASEMPKPPRSDYGGPEEGEDLPEELMPDSESLGDGITVLEDDITPEESPASLSVEERLTSVESRLGRLEDDLYN